MRNYLKTVSIILVLISLCTLVSCGKKKYTEGLEYYLLDDGSYAVGMGEGVLERNVVIPAEHNGRAVTEIIEEGFTCSSIVSITIPDSVTKIGESAFACCYSLETVKLPAELREICSLAFRECGSLRQVILPEKLETLGSYVFIHCDGIEKIYIPKSLKNFDKNFLDRIAHDADIYYAGSQQEWEDMGLKVGSFNYFDSVLTDD